ncbi:MAG: hypothetical protein WD894_19265 [Pirellulales bacterium]
MADTRVARTEDFMPVASRVSWGAIFAGGAMALATFLLLTLLGGSIGLSIRDEVNADTFGTTASIWAIASTIIALFVGGYITSQCTVGENPTESVVHGIIMWAVVFAFLIWMTIAGVRVGLSAMMGVASVGATAMHGVNQNWETLARQAGVPPERIEELRRDAAATAQDPQNREQAADVAMQASWWTLFGVMLSMVAAALGAFLGSGPRVRILGTASTTATTFRTPAASA